uniref:UBA domain-containing protein n=1 Tax=Minutocellus polymorphus TaxID=265543 RepID=A0A7S0AZC2_9STRA|mmetsp:Transcript_771/g.1322  ORF Transcript_771/g.1322 Transcript_771/m.1322 type:complete len:292 (+) Transcript_771:97-972(+)|eukprot:CAMPEP_0197726418 /NCGR_PEP_ID=MMETSP1434-20131217/15495_1 /TAXON_ID=265543 /ORGANISM="Minutocellus polymorphus, Strain CCMP3303" /LENGTH=291 /DNA_ID=CAMNT_0043312349 /DNA_START=94 /DNA_END=969 /DNA_ORIENTATION=-
MDDDTKLATLTSMGFDLDVAISALGACNGDVERAIELCLGGGVGGLVPAADTAAASSAGAGAGTAGTLLRVSDASQYTFGPDGRSACTCIALRYAERFLQTISQSAHASASTADAIVDESFLSEGLQQGVALYKTIKAGGSTSVEHMSAEEVLNNAHGKGAFANLKFDAPVRQGVLSSDPSSPLGMQAVLAGCQSESHWVAVIITKSPETIAVALPPSSSPSPSQLSGYFLLDSHPRPQLGANGSYAIAHDNMVSLGRTLSEIFPFTDLGSDVGEMMQMMYNSFDAYVLQQ